MKTSEIQDFERVWLVHEKYRLKNGFVVKEGRVKGAFYPHSEKYLYHRIAKIRNTRDVMRFVRRFGVLGYNKLLSRADEPVDWILTHAKTLNICMEIGLRLDEGEESIEDYLKELLEEEPSNQEVSDYIKREFEIKHNVGLIAPMDCIVQTLAAGTGTVDHSMGRRDNLAEYARNIRKMIINDNIAGVPLEMPFAFTGDILRPKFTALIEMAYYSLAHDLCSDDPRPHKRCPHCQSVFIKGNRKQRFCPPYSGQRESSCAYNFHKKITK